MEFTARILIAALMLFLNIVSALSRSTVDQDNQNEEGPDLMNEIQLHVLMKREAVNHLQQDYPHVEGRTFRASDPLDPNNAHTRNVDPPQSLFHEFETKDEIFQPEVDTEHSEKQDDDVITENTDPQHTIENKENDTNTGKEDTGTEYGAQYPYSETTFTRNEHHGSLPQTGSGYQTDDDLQQTVTSRRVVLAGRGSGTSGTGNSDTRGFEASRGFNEYRPSQTSRPGHTSHTVESSVGSQRGSGYPTSRQVSTERRVYSGYSGRDPSTSGYQSSRTEARGPYYGGQRYIDSNGHYVDAQGRHLDSTGRYYDISGQYQDATMTGVQTYRHTGTRPTPVHNTVPNSGYYERTRSTETNSGTGYYDSSGRYITSGSGSGTNQGGRYVDTSRSRPIDSYGGTQFYSGGRSYQTTYDPVASEISSDPNCPVTNTQVTINGLTCNNAVSQLGPYVCYNYERVSTECCERCLQVKRPENSGCEYGDRSHQCRDIQPFDCYDGRNRQICCDRCRQFRDQRASTTTAGCEYGDLTPRCQSMLQRPHLCYLPENQRICCQTCPRLANSREPSCQWGNQSPELCQPFDTNRRLQLNCYMQSVQEFCCATCNSLRERMRDNIPGCEFGDSPVLFYSGGQALDCPGYISQYGLENCDDQEVARKCCYTCHRYRRSRG